MWWHKVSLIWSEDVHEQAGLAPCCHEQATELSWSLTLLVALSAMGLECPKSLLLLLVVGAVSHGGGRAPTHPCPMGR